MSALLTCDGKIPPYLDSSIGLLLVINAWESKFYEETGNPFESAAAAASIGETINFDIFLFLAPDWGTEPSILLMFFEVEKSMLREEPRLPDLGDAPLYWWWTGVLQPSGAAPSPWRCRALFLGVVYSRWVFFAFSLLLCWKPPSLLVARFSA